MAQESVIHRIDAELGAGARHPSRPPPLGLEPRDPASPTSVKIEGNPEALTELRRCVVEATQ
jgi:hypothetical protein